MSQSQATILEFASDPRFKNLAFPDLEIRFEKHLEQVKSLTDLDALIRSIRPIFQDKRYSAEDLERLKKLRQRAYDRKRNQKFHMASNLDRIDQKRSPVIEQFSAKPPVQTGAPMPTAITEKPLTPEVNCPGLSQGTIKAFARINGEHLLKTAPKLLTLCTTTSLVSFFLWHQSLALYDSAGFADSIYAAAGGLLMVIGFAAYHAITRSWLALFFCLYAGTYEGYLMISGTINNDHQIKIQTIQTSPDLVFLKEKAAKSLAYYHELKQRYDNPESKVFKNDWFLKTNLNPAWQESAATHKELMAKESALTGAMQSGHITWLKILYRLGLVFLCMMLVHRFFASFLTKNTSCQ